MAGLCGLFMLTVAIRQYGPTVHPDEFGFLTNGQALIGHDEAAIPTGSFYPAGYGIVTGLGALLSGSISGAYRFALLTNVLLAVATAWYAGRLAQRGFGASRHMALLISALVFVVPGTIVSAMFSWAETASRLAFLVFVGFVMRAAQARTRALVLGLGLFTGLMPALHGRFILLLPIVCLLFAWWWRRKEITFVTATSAVVLTAVAYFSTYLLNRFVKTAVYTTSGTFGESWCVARFAANNGGPELVSDCEFMRTHRYRNLFHCVSRGWQWWKKNTGVRC